MSGCSARNTCPQAPRSSSPEPVYRNSRAGGNPKPLRTEGKVSKGRGKGEKEKGKEGKRLKSKGVRKWEKERKGRQNIVRRKKMDGK